MATLAVMFILSTKRSRTDAISPQTLRDGMGELRQLLAESHLVEGLSAVVDGLCVVMEHPQLGGPGFLSVQFPLAGCGGPEISALYPNIQETLYRKIVRGELDREDLIRAGVPTVLFGYGVEFETESGGMVRVTALAGELPGELERRMRDHRGRTGILQILEEELGRKYPDWMVRAYGGELLITPK